MKVLDCPAGVTEDLSMTTTTAAHLTRVNVGGTEYTVPAARLSMLVEKIGTDGFAAHEDEADELSDHMLEWATGLIPSGMDLQDWYDYLTIRGELS